MGCSGQGVNVTSVDPLLLWRKEFPILATTTYMTSHSLGAMPLRVQDALAEFTEIWATRGIRAWNEGWWEMPRSVGNLIDASSAPVPEKS